MTARVIHGQDNAAYHAGPGLSHSDLKRLRRSPFHFMAMRRDSGRRDKEPTAAMFNGTLVHCALLEPDQFDRRYVAGDFADKRSSEYKRLSAQVLHETIITTVQREAAFAQAAALRELPQVAELLAAGHPEVSAYWLDSEHDVLCKCRPDWVSPVGYGKGAILLDVKTTSDASADQFSRSIANFEYHTQADWYCTGYALAAGVEVHGMVFAVVENEYPYAATVYMLDDAALRLAHERNRAALNTYVRCTEQQEWPGYPNTIQVIGLPRWAMKDAYA